MFDFSPTGILTAIALSLWTSLSSVSMAAIASAALLLVAAHRAVSPVTRGTLLGLAAGLGAFGLLWQGAATDGARKMEAHAHALALRAERERAEMAETVNRDLAERATRDLAEAQADNSKLKDMNDALAHHPRRDGACVPRDLARRLRAL